MGAHTTAEIGKYCFVRLKNEHSFVAILEKIASRYYWFRDYGTVMRKEVKSISINKPA